MSNAIEYSPEQKLAIKETGKNIIVSAGAGSGKTAVLTERIKQILKSGIKANQLLVLTFTKLAASEMKERISKKMAEDESLKSRTSEVDNAYITTFDSFSFSLVKRYHDRLNLSSNLTIIESSVLNVYKRKVIDEIFESYYLSDNDKFKDLLNDFSTKDDSTLKKEILSLANKIDNRTDREGYLKNIVANTYNEKTYNDYLNQYVDILKTKLDYVIGLIAKLEGKIKDEAYAKFVEASNILSTCKNYNQIRYNCVPKYNMPRLVKPTSEVFIIKEQISDTLDSISKLCIYPNDTYIKEVYFASQKYLEIIVEILIKYFQKVENYKKEKEAFEFIDIAKMAICLVKDNKDIKDELTDSFYEILVDEYQDTNNIQEEFISYISKNNVYMVGDIKQSIYGFRNANPIIFKNKYDAYKDNTKGLKIDLNQNFRSNIPVLDTINKIFNRIMDDKIGQADFEKEHQMRFGLKAYNQYPQNDKIRYVTYPTNPSLYKTKNVDMFFVAKDIKRKIESKELVYDSDLKKFRELTYKDFAILIADSKQFDNLSRLLDYNNIPNLVYKNNELNKGVIVSIIKNIVKLITLDKKECYDNSFKHSFLAVARSFVMEYDDEYIFDLLTTNSFKESSLYQKIHNFVDIIDCSSLSFIIYKIIDDFDIEAKLIKIGDIKENLARIEFSINIASSMEKLDLDIYDFVTYIEDIFSNDEKLEFAISDAKENKVKIMTIHKSKGLEFPIVYFINNDALFNKADIKGRIIYSNKYGIITPFYNEGEGKNIQSLLLKEQNNLELVSEKIRLLYVALTRAREQMIIVNPYNPNNLPIAIENNLIPNAIKEKYNSFGSIYNSVIDNFNLIRQEIDPLELNINEDYLKSSKLDPSTLITKNDIVITKYTNNIDSKLIEKKHASKEEIELRDGNTLKVLELGTKAHEVLESVDFINPDYSKYDNEEKAIIKAFLDNPIMSNIKKGKIYKEFEFIDNNDGLSMHGIIDLMVVYDNHIDIIDYKLSHTDDKAYISQLNGYKSYIVKKLKKPVFLYLYSIKKRQIFPLN